MPENKDNAQSIEVTVDASDAIRKIEDAKKKAPEFDVKAERDQARKEEKNRIREIMAISERHNLQKLGQEYIEKGHSLDDFRVKVLETLGDVVPIDPVPKDHLGMSEKDKQQFSILRAVNGLVSGNMEKNAPFEYSVSQEIEKRVGKPARGFYIPNDIKHRDLNVTTATAGGNVVATDLLSGSFIEMLRNRMVTRQLGATVLSGLVGNVAIPKQSGAATAYWVAESNAPTESQQTFAQVTMSPKTVGAYTDISRKLLLQSSISIENLVQMDLAKVLAIEIDRAAIAGTGSSNEPTGILNTSGIGNVGSSPSAPTYANIIELWSDVAVENADYGSIGFLTNPLVCAKLMQTFTNSTYGEIPVWQGGPGDGTMLGFRSLVSNQVPSNLTSSSGASSDDGVLSAILFGNWADLLIGEWSGTDITIDPYSNSTSGTLRIVVLQDLDIAVRHSESFSCMQEVDLN